MASSPITLNPFSPQMAIHISFADSPIGGLKTALRYMTDYTR